MYFKANLGRWQVKFKFPACYRNVIQYSLPFFSRVRFNPFMERLKLHYTPQFDQAAIERDLHSLLVSGAISDNNIEGRITRLAESFRIYAAYYPYGLWAPGLAITREMRILTEIYLPVDDIRRAFDHFFSVALSFRVASA